MPAYKNTKNGTWIVKFSYLDWERKRRWVTKRGFKTKHDAKGWEDDFFLKTAGTINMTMKAFCNLYFSTKETRLKPDTLAMKKSIVDKWILPYLGEIPVNKLDAETIILWQNKLIKYTQPNGRKLSKSYLKTVHNQLTAILNHAVKYYELPKNPAAIVGNMGTDKYVKNDYWTIDEYHKFSEAMMDEPLYYYPFQFLYYCGLREGELLALTKNDIDLVNHTVQINKTYYVLNGKEYVTTPKTQKSIRAVSIPKTLSEEFQDYLNMIYQPDDNQRIFPLSKSMLHRAIKRGAKKAGIKPIRVHDLRHSHVSLLIHMGLSPVAIGERVGHESVYITYHYAHLFPTVQKDIAKKLDTIIENKKESQDDTDE